MRCIYLLLALLITEAEAQMPRSKSGSFEYTGEISGGDTPLMTQKAKSFFNQPFLVHWDSVARIEEGGRTRVTGRGYITVKAKQHSVALPAEVPVSLQFSIEVREGHYRYTVNQFKIDKETPVTFPLEEKPDSIKSMVYDQLLQRTHRRMVFVIGWLKRYMEGAE